MNAGVLNKVYIAFGRIANKIPYSFVPKVGSIYCSAQKDIEIFEKSKNKEELIFKKVHAIVEYAINNIKFYQDFYRNRGFDIKDLKSFDDIVKIPIVTKDDLINIPLEDRSGFLENSRIVNTGGSTGKPLSFYKPKMHKVKEWAYYIWAWNRMGFSKGDLRLKFVGRQKTSGLKYEMQRNQFQVSIYEPFGQILNELNKLNCNFKITQLAGYPSVLYLFALYCEEHLVEFENSYLTKSLRMISLNSEYPHPTYRKKIEEVFGVKTIASYGHTEGICLAFDFGDSKYKVLQSYGYSESVQMEDGNHLVGTTYDNFASPLIRYDTNDIMDDVAYDNGILSSFKMTGGGRNGQYIEDKNGNKISLTGLIFGKHHELFNYSSQIQIAQKEKGFAKVYYTVLKPLPEGKKADSFFDCGGVDIEFQFKELSEPIRTSAGKVLLLVPYK